MKKIIQLAFLILLVSMMACEGPRNSRSLSSTSSNDFNRLNSNGYSNTGSSFTFDETGNSTTTPTPSNIPAEISHCTWSTDGISGHQSTSSHLGNYTFCQSSTNELDVYLQLKNPITDSQICIIPTFNNGSSSIYIGEPRCLTATDNMKVYKIKLIKNRSGYSNFAVSGAMIMKDKAYYYPSPFSQYTLTPDAYIFCSNYLDQHGIDSYCQAFRTVNQYKYHQF